MTTIIYDAKNKQMLGDGRISQGTQVTKDDFVKVHNINGILVGAAGVVTHMLKFFEYFEQNTTAEIFQQETMGLVNIVFPETPNEDQFEALVAYPSGELFLFEGNSSILLGQDVSFAIGSGGPYALGALESGAAGDEAMRVATKFDTMSGGEITIVQLEEEPEPLSREVAENLSKEELINMMFGEEENNEITEGTVSALEEEEQKDKVVWGDNKVTLYFPDKDNPEYFVSFEVEKNKMYAECDLYELDVTVMEEWFYDIEDLRNYCEYMSIKHKPSNTYKQLAKKIIEEIKAKVPQQ